MKMRKEVTLKSERVKDHFGKLWMIQMIPKTFKKYKNPSVMTIQSILHSETQKSNWKRMQMVTLSLSIQKPDLYEL